MTPGELRTGASAPSTNPRDSLILRERATAGHPDPQGHRAPCTQTSCTVASHGSEGDPIPSGQPLACCWASHSSFLPARGQRARETGDMNLCAASVGAQCPRLPGKGRDPAHVLRVDSICVQKRRRLRIKDVSHSRII